MKVSKKTLLIFPLNTTHTAYGGFIFLRVNVTLTK